MPRGKSRNGSAGEGGAHLPALVNPRLVKALGHIVRQHILLAAIQGPVSPNELSKLLGGGLAQVSYHVRVLNRDCDELIELVSTEPRRGATEHYYRATAKTLLPAKAWRQLKKGLRAVVGAGQASDLFDDLAGALKAGKLQGPHDHIARTLMVLDAKGQRNVKAIAERATEEAEDEQQAAAKRIEANGDGGKASGCTFALLAFETAWKPGDLHSLSSHPRSSVIERASGAAQGGGGEKRGGRKAGT
jgi:hypothetical protein